MKKCYPAISMVFFLLAAATPAITAVTLTVGDGSGYKGSHYNPVTVSLDNPDDTVKLIQLDVCDADNYLSLNTLLRCETTSRSGGFSFQALDLPNGCTRIVMSSTTVPCPALIAEGSGPIFTINYDVSTSAPSGQCRNLTPQNGSVRDQDGNLIAALSYGPAGQFCFSSCASAADCNDTKYCNGTEGCSGGVCNHTGSPCSGTQCNTCNETNDSCFSPAGTPCTNDGLFCNGNEICNGSGACGHTFDACPPGTDCNEADDVCNCGLEDDCNDGLWCNGEEFCFLGKCISTVDRCTGSYETHCDESNDQCVCCVDSECDDGQWCTGEESCNSDTCADNADPCSPPQVCDEENDMCIQPDVTLTVNDGSGFIGLSQMQVGVRLANPFDKVSAVQMTICEEIDYLRVPPTVCEDHPSVFCQTRYDCEVNEACVYQYNPCVVSSRTTGFECIVGEDINGCTTVILRDDERLYNINQGTGTIVTLRLNVKEAGEAETGCIDLNVTDSLVIDDAEFELTSLGVPGEFCIQCTANADCADTIAFCTGTDTSCASNVDCEAGTCSITSLPCYIEGHCPPYIQTCVSGGFCTQAGVCSNNGVPCNDDDDCDVCNKTLASCDEDEDCLTLPQTCEDAQTCDGTPDVCTNDTCGSDFLCDHTPNTAVCDDGLYCTTMDRCSGGVCVGTGDPCGTCEMCQEQTQQCVTCTNDCDCDGVLDAAPDNCNAIQNGFLYGTCARLLGGVVAGTGVLCTSDDDCGFDAVCEKSQQDFNGNGIGDVCECYADTNCDTKVNLTDLVKMKSEFNRTNCSPSIPCYADCNDDDKVNLTDLVIMKGQFNRTDCAPCP